MFIRRMSISSNSSRVPEAFLEANVLRPGGGSSAAGLGPYRTTASDAKEVRYSAGGRLLRRRSKAAAADCRAVVSQCLGRCRCGCCAATCRPSIASDPRKRRQLRRLGRDYGRDLLSVDAPFARAEFSPAGDAGSALSTRAPHAIDRNAIFSQQLSRGKPVAGNEVIDRLFSKSGADNAGAGRLGVDFRYDPAVSSLLAKFSLASAGAAPAATAATDDKSAPPQIIEVTLALPADEIARLACGAIQRQLQTAGIGVRLHELAPGSADTEADLTYVEWTPLEPAAEFLGLIGPAGPGGNADPAVAKWVYDVVAAPSADRTADAIAALDDGISDHLLVIPLWRLNEYAAYHKSLHGFGSRPVTLYQNVEQWQLGEK